jgi:membrane fusion protein (multidrug efflux system)
VAETQAAVLAADADIQTAQATVSGATARVGMAQASAGQARAQLSEASTVKGYTEIRATYGGVVTARNVAPGTLVQPGTSLLKIAKTDVVRIQVNVSEADLAQVAVGQTIVAHGMDAPNAPLTARISAIFPAQDPSTRTAIVEARVANSDGRLHPGAYLSVDLLLGTQRPALSAPTAALITRDGQTTVFVVANDGLRATVRRAAVTTGRVSNSRTEILSGLQAGEQVITSGLANLHDGDAITVLQHGTAPAASPANDAAALPTPPRAETTVMADARSEDKLPAPSVSHARPNAAKKQLTKAGAPKTGQPTKIAKIWYHCPMHVDMISDKPGKCPKCGMQYVPFEKK